MNVHYDDAEENSVDLMNLMLMKGRSLPRSEIQLVALKQSTTCTANQPLYSQATVVRVKIKYHSTARHSEHVGANKRVLYPLGTNHGNGKLPVSVRFIDAFPIKTSIYQGFSMAMLNNERVIS